MKKIYLALLTIFIWGCAVTSGQTPARVKKLYAAVQKSGNDTAQISRLVELATYQIQKQGTFKNDMDSASDFISRAVQINNKLKDNTSTGRICLAMSYFYEDQKQWPLVKTFAEKAIAAFEKTTDNYSSIGYAYIQLAHFYPNSNGGYDRVEKAVSTAIIFYHRAKNWEREEYCYEFLGDVVSLEGDLDGAEKDEKHAIEIAGIIHKTNLQRMYDMLDDINNERGNYRDAMRFGLLALSTAESEHDTTTTLCTIYNRLGVVFNNLNEGTKAAEYFKKALAVALQNHDDGATTIVVANLSRTMKKLHRSAEGLQILEQCLKEHNLQMDASSHLMLSMCLLDLNTDLKNYKAAQIYCNEVLREDETPIAADKKREYPLLVAFFIQTKQYQKALKYLNLDDGLAPIVKGTKFEAENQRLWFMFDTAKNNYKSAISHLISFQAVNDSIFNEAKSKEFAGLELAYGKEKDSIQLKLKDQNIRLLNQNAQIGATKLKSVELSKNLVFGTSILLLIILILVFYQYRLKKNTNVLITEKNLSMQTLLGEMEVLLGDKEMLIKEVHHRVKNNLHMVSSLLESQSAYLENEALAAVQQSQHRVQAISILHQKMYLNDSITSVLMPVYLREIVSYLKASFVVKGNIVFALDFDEIELDVSQAVPVGLIVNEAVTNAIKYAFPGHLRGMIKISLKVNSADEVMLSISDNGTGLHKDFDLSKNTSLGMSLIKGLGKSLGARFTLNSGEGTSIVFVFDPQLILDAV